MMLPQHPDQASLADAADLAALLDLVLDENTLCDRFADATAGEAITYHIGMLARDRDKVATDLSLHVERCAERYTAVREEICGLRKQSRRIEGAIWGIVAVLIALGAGGAQILPILRALSRAAGG
jgi:hypothetical protein